MSKPSYDELEKRIEELQSVETKLRDSEEKFRLAFHTNPDSINLNRLSDGLYLDINQGFTRLMGYTRDEVIGKTSLELNIWSNPDDRAKLVKGLTTQGYVDGLEAEFRRKNGEVGTGLMSARVLTMHETKVILSVTRDISEQKRSERELKHFKKALESSTNAVGMSTPDGLHWYQNKAFDDMFGDIGADPPATLYADETVGREVFDTIMGGGSWEGEVEMYDCEKNIRNIFLRAYAIKDSSGKVAGLVGVHIDITERKQNELEVRNRLKEKEILLRELNHRVRNNLNVISSLINLQALDVNSPEEAIEALEKSRDRVAAMAAVHKSLYQSEGVMSVNMHGYVEKLVDDLLCMHLGTQEIHTDIQVSDVELHIGNAVPCALILNELITNSFKHAFDDSQEGKLIVHFRKLKENLAELTVQDNGPGLPEIIESTPQRSLGMTLVHSLTDQIRGNVNVSSESGTCIKITFPID